MTSQDSGGRETVPPDIDIALRANRRAIEDVGADLGLDPAALERRGDEVAKVTWPASSGPWSVPRTGASSSSPR